MIKNPRFISRPSKFLSVSLKTPRYGYVYKDGERCFVDVGEIDDFLEIQERFTDSDYAVMRQIMQSLYCDFDWSEFFDTNVIPCSSFSSDSLISLIDASDQVRYIEEQFEYLPLEVKEKYGNSATKFARSVCDGSFYSEFSPEKSGEGPGSRVEYGGKFDKKDVDTPVKSANGVSVEQLEQMLTELKKTDGGQKK